MLSFGSPLPFADRVKAAGVPLICQVQTLAMAREALEADADAIVAQGGEAGGHGGTRATLTLVPEIADLLARESPDILLVAAGGMADGRGLAAALMLGADGVLLGSRFVASREAKVPSGFKEAIAAADGDATIKAHVMDIVRGFDWPKQFSGRTLNRGFTARWHGHEADLQEAETNAVERERFWAGFRDGDLECAGLFIGEAVGLVDNVRPAAEIVGELVTEAESLLASAARYLRPPSGEM